MALTCGRSAAVSFSAMTASIPSDGSARTSSPMSSSSARPRRPVPAPMSTTRVGPREIGTLARIASAASPARAIRSGVSQSFARSSNVAIWP